MLAGRVEVTCRLFKKKQIRLAEEHQRLEQGVESFLLEVLVMGKNIAEIPFSHHLHRHAIDHARAELDSVL